MAHQLQPEYVACVMTAGRIVKVWCQENTEAVRELHERLQSVRFDEFGAVQSRSDISPNTTLAVKYKNQYFRCNVVVANETRASVFLIDYAQTIEVNLSELRLLDVALRESGFPPLTPTPLCNDYVLFGVLTARDWSVEECSYVNHIIHGSPTHASIVSDVGGKKAVNVSVIMNNNVVDLRNVLLTKSLVTEVSAESQNVIIRRSLEMSEMMNQRGCQAQYPINPAEYAEEVGYRPSANPSAQRASNAGVYPARTPVQRGPSVGPQLATRLNNRAEELRTGVGAAQFQQNVAMPVAQQNIPPVSLNNVVICERPQRRVIQQTRPPVMDSLSHQPVYSLPEVVTTPAPQNSSHIRQVNHYPQMVMSPSHEYYPAQYPVDIPQPQAPMSYVFPQQPTIHPDPYSVMPSYPQSVPVMTLDVDQYQFRYGSLEIGQMFDATVSSVIDGPLYFVVHLTSEVPLLINMMSQIRASLLERMSSTIGPGTVCLAIHQQDRSLCRAVVSDVRCNTIVAYFVDFGYTEVVPLADIYKMPLEFMREKALAYRLSLDNLQPSDITDNVIESFKRLVMHRPIKVKALRQSQDSCKQVADVYVKDPTGRNSNLRYLLPLAKLSYVTVPEPDRSTVTEVVVSHVESTRKFFIRYAAHNRNLDRLMASLEQYCNQAETDAFLTVQDLAEDMPVCALYDNHWYRAVITQMVEDANTVPVFYVDYGNEEIVSIEMLLKIRKDFVERFQAQAVECIYSGLESLEDEVYIDLFSDIVLEKEFNMKIINVLPNKVLVVELKDKVTGVSVRDQLIENMVEPPIGIVENNGDAGSDVEWEQSVAQNIDDSVVITRTVQQQVHSQPPPPSGSREDVLSTLGQRSASSAQSEEPRRTQVRGRGENHYSRIGTKYEADSYSWRNERNDSSEATQPRESRREGGRGFEDTEPRKWRNEDFSGRQDKDRRPGEDRGGYSGSDSQREDRGGYKRSDSQREDRGGYRGSDSQREDRGGYRRSDFQKEDRSGRFGRNNGEENGSDQLSGQGTTNNTEMGRYGRRNKEENGFEESQDNQISGQGGNAASRRYSEFGNDKSEGEQRRGFGQDAGSKWRSGERQFDSRNTETTNRGRQFRNREEQSQENRQEQHQEESWDDGPFVPPTIPATSNDYSGDYNKGSDTANFGESFGSDSERPKREYSDDRPRGRRNFDDNKRFDSGNKPFGDKTFGRREGGFTKNREERLFGRKPFTPQLLDGFPKGAQLSDYSVTIDSSLKCCVTWFVSPDCFYIQVVNPEFRELMQTIQEEYKNRKPSDNIEVGDSVIARCSEDRVLYRARVTEVTFDSVNVYFVDYGNCDTCKKEYVWNISEDHCIIPSQAILCRLNGIKQLEQKPWSSLQAVIDNYFSQDEYIATVIDKQEDTTGTMWKVSMTDENGEDVCAKIVADGNAQQECTQLTAEPPADLPMLENQTIAVYVAHVESSQKFFVHLEPDKVRALQDTINTVVATIKMKQMPAEDVTEDAVCLVPYESSDCAAEWYRARVINVNTETATVNIQYLEYGDEDTVSFYKVHVVPDKLLTYSVQATECSLFNPDDEKLSDEMEEQFETKTYQKDLIAHVNCVKDYKLIVTLYDIDGVHLGFPKEVNDVICPLPSMPLLRQQDDVKITQLTVKDKELVVYIRRISDQNEVNEIENKKSVLAAINSEPPTNLELGAICVVQTEYRDGWCRGKVINKKDDDTYDIYCVDFGYTVNVNLQDVRLLGKGCYCVGETCTQEHTDEEKVGYWPGELCAEVYTDIVCSGEPESEAQQEKLDELYLSIEEDTFKVELSRTETNSWKGSFVSIKTNKTLEKYCEQLEHGTKKEQKQKYSPLKEWLKKKSYRPVVISHYESPSSFWVVLREDLVKVENLQKNLHSALRCCPTIKKNFEGFFASKYPKDGKWYRSEVNETDAVSVDFGYPTEPKNLKVMPYMLQNEPKYAIKCSLGITASDSANNFFKDLAERDVVGRIDILDIDAHLVTLKHGEENVRNILLKDSDVLSFDVGISHVEGLGAFYVQRLDHADILYKIQEALEHADEWEHVNPEYEGIVAAKFSEDELWYRGRVFITEDVRKVYFVDYGNSCVCTEIRSLPQDLATIPFLAEKCTLMNSIQKHHDTSKINAAFLSLAEKPDAIFSVKFTDYAKTPIPVTMMYKNKEILSFLNAVSKRQIPPAEIRVGSSVKISYLESPASFYVQDAEMDTAQLDEILKNIEQAEQPEAVSANDLIVAKHPDGCWYRGEVVIVSDEGYAVLFLDYGDLELTTEVRVLPEDAFLIPLLAKHCSLALPEGYTEWPGHATEKFGNMSCEGLTTFKVASLIDGDPAVVELEDNGSNVAKELIAVSEINEPTTEIIVSHVNSLENFFIQYKTANLDEMADELANADTFDPVSDVSEGAIVAAVFTDDGAWYRAKILDILSGSYKVMFIDYGNISISAEIRALPEDLAKLPPLAKECALKLPENVTILENAVEIFENIANSEDSVIRLQNIEQRKFVTLSVNGRNLLELISTQQSNTSVELESQEIPEGESIELVTSQPVAEEQLDEIELMSQTFPEQVSSESAELTSQTVQKEEETSGEAIEPTIPAKCIDETGIDETIKGPELVEEIPKSNEDEIENATTPDEMEADDSVDTEIHILLGPGPEVIEIEEIRSPEFAESDSTSIKSVEKDTSSELVSPSATSEIEKEEETEDQKMPEIVATSTDSLQQVSEEIGEYPDEISRETSSKVEEIDPQVVVTYEEHNGEDKNGDVLKKTEMTAVVLHVNSLSSFYVRDLTAQLNDVENKMSKAEKFGPVQNLMIGSLVAAKFLENSWRRAKITDLSDEIMPEIYYVDYGSTDITSVENLRELPDDLKNLPMLAKHCCLEYEMMSHELEEFIVPGRVIKFTILVDGDLTVIELLDKPEKEILHTDVEIPPREEISDKDLPRI